MTRHVRPRRHRASWKGSRGLAVALSMSGALFAALPAEASPVAEAAALRPARHIVDRTDAFSFVLPPALTPEPVGLLHGKAGKHVVFFAVTSRPSGVVVEDVLVTVYAGRLLRGVAVLRSLLGAPLDIVHVATAKVAFGPVLKGSVTMLRGTTRVDAVAYLFSRNGRTYAVAFNGLNRAHNAAVAKAVMATWGR